MSNWNASDNGLGGIRESLNRIARYLERKEERETAIKDTPVECDLGKTRSTREPLIKDEKIRKAVRAWADANGYSEGIYFTNFGVDNTCYFLNDAYDDKQIWFDKCLQNIKSDETYTIAELCGESDND